MAGKGNPKTGGRKKGTPNKSTLHVKQSIMDAFERVGGTDWLVRLADDDPKTFAALLSKILPSEMKADIDVSGRVKVVMKDLTGESDD